MFVPIHITYKHDCSNKEYKTKIVFCEDVNKKIVIVVFVFSPINDFKIYNMTLNNIFSCTVITEGAPFYALVEGLTRGKVTKNRISYYKKSQILIKYFRYSKKLRIIIINVTNLNKAIFFLVGYKKNILDHNNFKEFHDIKKRSISNVGNNTNDDLLYLNDCYHMPLHFVVNVSETSAQNEITKNSTQQNGYFPKQKIRKIVAEKGHLTLNCPEIIMDSNVQWYKDNERLNSSFRNNMADTEIEPHITIDAYNSLYILQATKNEEAVYTCYVDDKLIQTYLVVVVSKSKLLNEEFFRYSIYLGFVLSLTITCYCAGICVAWHQRAYFADPLRYELTT